MKSNEQSGFILMIVVMIAIAVFVIGFAVYRITNANSADDSEALVLSYSIAYNR